jgi:hypothetical protein
VKRPRTLFRVAAVASAVLLVGSFVAYRAGAVQRFMGAATFSSSKSSKVFVPVSDTDQPSLSPAELDQAIMAGSKSSIIMSGSKSDRVALPQVTQQQAPAKANPPAAVMGGSKSISVGPLVPVQPVKPPAATAQPPAPQQ